MQPVNFTTNVLSASITDSCLLWQHAKVHPSPLLSLSLSLTHSLTHSRSLAQSHTRTEHSRVGMRKNEESPCMVCSICQVCRPLEQLAKVKVLGQNYLVMFPCSILRGYTVTLQLSQWVYSIDVHITQTTLLPEGTFRPPAQVRNLHVTSCQEAVGVSHSYARAWRNQILLTPITSSSILSPWYSHD